MPHIQYCNSFSLLVSHFYVTAILYGNTTIEPIPYLWLFSPQLVTITHTQIYQHLLHTSLCGTDACITLISRSRVCCLLSGSYYLYISLYCFPIHDTTPQLICKFKAQIISSFCISPTLPSAQILVKLHRFQGAWHIHPLQTCGNKYLPQVILEFHDHILADKGLEKE